MNRREFLKGTVATAGAAAAGCAVAAPRCSGGVCSIVAPANAPLIASAPMLQNPAPTSMGVAFAVSSMANGFVEYSESADMKAAKRVKCGGFRVTDMNDKVMLVRLTGLKPATRYYYRIGADRIKYGGGYDMKVLGTEIDPAVRSFTTAGGAAGSHFCVCNDTHAVWSSFGPVVDKIAELKPALAVWNGDACNTQETIDSLVQIFLNPGISRKDYASEIPFCLVPGNHDQRGLACRRLERVFMFRQPEERLSRDWDIGRNFAFRLGDIALVGLDTGEDKPDGRDVFAGLFNNEAYRVAQTAWLADALERPEIKSAPYLVAFCHIPLFDPRPWANPGGTYDNCGGKYRHDFAIWEKSCAELWGPLFKRHGVQLLIAAHQHEYRYDAPAADRPWAQIVGGSPTLDEKRGRFATVIEGKVEAGELKIAVHDLHHGRIAGEFSFKPRA